MLHTLRSQSGLKKAGVIASAALVAGTGVLFTANAFADPTPQAACDSGDNRHFRARAHVEPSVGDHEVITGYSYKLWGAIGDKSNVDFKLYNESGTFVTSTWVERDEIPETGDDEWVWVDLKPNRALDPDNIYQVDASVKFDVGGTDPRCADRSPFF